MESPFTNFSSALILPWVRGIRAVGCRREHIRSRVHKHLSVLTPSDRASSRYPGCQPYRQRLGLL